MGPRLPFLQVLKEGRREQAAAEDVNKHPKTSSQKTQYLESEHDEDKTAMGSRDGKTEL